MNEDFVTSELAKKLKDKGFKEKCIAKYCKGSLVLNKVVIDGECEYIDYYKEIKIYDLLSDNDNKYTILAPTISQVLKWLRKDKNIHITIDVDINDNFDFYFTILKKGEESWEVLQHGESCKTYEKAELFAISYVIDNLI